MEIIIEDCLNVKTLEVGDFVVSSNGKKLFMVIEMSSSEDTFYAIKRVDVEKGFLLEDTCLKRLTEKAINYDLKIYPKSKYELVLRNKKIV